LELSTYALAWDKKTEMKITILETSIGKVQFPSQICKSMDPEALILVAKFAKIPSDPCESEAPSLA
jgi:hypothetical protein